MAPRAVFSPRMPFAKGPSGHGWDTAGHGRGRGGGGGRGAQTSSIGRVSSSQAPAPAAAAETPAKPATRQWSRLRSNLANRNLSFKDLSNVMPKSSPKKASPPPPAQEPLLPKKSHWSRVQSSLAGKGLSLKDLDALVKPRTPLGPRQNAPLLVRVREDPAEPRTPLGPRPNGPLLVREDPADNSSCVASTPSATVLDQSFFNLSPGDEIWDSAGATSE